MRNSLGMHEDNYNKKYLKIERKQWFLTFNCVFFFLLVRTVDVAAVEGNRISLPCPLVPPSRDKVYMVLWFRDDAGIPLYRYVVTKIFILTFLCMIHTTTRSLITIIEQKLLNWKCHNKVITKVSVCSLN